MDDKEKIAVMEEALREIALGRGPHSRDQLIHAENTIEAMKQRAKEALVRVELE